MVVMETIDSQSNPSATNTESSPPIFHASIKRRLLAVYIDFVMFGAAWIALSYFLRQALTLITPRFAGLIIFAALEIVALKVKVSPGYSFLSIYPISLRRKDDAAKSKTMLLVDPRIKPFESWYAMILSVLFILDGSKSLTRWTLGMPALPFWSEAMPVVNILAGVVYFVIAYYILKLRRRGTRLAMIWMLVWMGYVCIAWNKWDGWIHDQLIARAALTGRDVQPEAIAFVQQFVPEVFVIFIPVLLGLIYIAHRKMRYD